MSRLASPRRLRDCLIGVVLLTLALVWPVFAQPTPAAETASTDSPATESTRERDSIRPIATAIAGDSIFQTTLVGASGQLYAPIAPGHWQRTIAGGVAAHITSAVRLRPDRVMIAGARSPLYRMVNGVWHGVRLPRRGQLLLATHGGIPILAIGRQLYRWNSDAWTKVAWTRGTPSAIWASSTERIYVALGKGAIDKWHKGRWSRIGNSLAADDTVVHFEGVPGKALYALANTGAILDVGARRASLVTRAADLNDTVPHAVDVMSDGTLWLVGARRPSASTQAASGRVPSAEAKRDAPAAGDSTDTPAEGAPARADDSADARIVLARRLVRGASKSLTMVESLAMIPSDQRVVVLQRDKHGDVLIVTDRGQVHYRKESAGWQRGQLSDALPVKQSGQQATGPARTR